ncbi:MULTISPECIES: ABC transporter ATP-binding protein [unclassified Microbacterium]|uniref:ABC transporter ATP-binding protein n=1 Tax=unclassified Microbacterium TaxID=2609290 RepID=UPI003655C283
MIEIEGLRAGYGSLDILRGVDLRVRPGTVSCIIGPNGAGKSTVLKTISGLLRASAGRILVDGADVTELAPKELLRAGIAQVPQRHGLFPTLTVRQNVELGAYALGLSRREVAGRYDELATSFPQLSTRPNIPASLLSGGQRRTVEFARALIIRPRVVLLDEPTLGLDPHSLDLIDDSIRRMTASGVTVLMVEQNVRFGLGLADDAVLVSAGRVAVAGTASEMESDPNLMDWFFGDAVPEASGATASGAIEGERS